MSEVWMVGPFRQLLPGLPYLLFSHSHLLPGPRQVLESADCKEVRNHGLKQKLHT